MESIKSLVTWGNTNDGFALVVLTLVYVAATLWLALLARKQLDLASELEQSRTRPFVLFEVVAERGLVYAQLSNTGQTPAYNVRITTSPAIRCLIRSGHGPLTFIEEGLPMLSPARTIRALLGSWSEVEKAYPNLKFTSTVTYETGPPRKRRYSDVLFSDLAILSGILYTSRKGQHEIVGELEKIARSLHEICAGFKSPLVRTISEREFREAEERRLTELYEAVAKNEEAGGPKSTLPTDPPRND